MNANKTIVLKNLPDQKNKGVALVTALLIVSLATIMAVTLASRQYIDVRRTGNIMLADQAYLYSLAMENFAGQLLAYYRNKAQSKFDNRAEFDAAMVQFSAFPVEGGSVAVSVSYPEAKFNVNSLIKKDGTVNEQQKDRYYRLVKLVLTDLGFGISQADDLLNPLLDWLDPDEDTRPAGAEDGIYESKEPPYKAANRMMASISELKLVEGYTPELLYGKPADEEHEAIPGLLHYVTALPDRDTALNVNLVGEDNFKQFMAMSAYIDEAMAKELMVTDKPYESVDAFRKSSVFDSVKGDDKGGDRKELNENIATGLDVQSSYFVLSGVATVGQTVVKLNSLIYVSTDGTKFEVLSRAIGTDGI